jgi:hypothetical protein
MTRRILGGSSCEDHLACWMLATKAKHESWRRAQRHEPGCIIEVSVNLQIFYFHGVLNILFL